MEILKARPGDTEALTRISFAAKRHWGYPESWIERWRETLTITPEFIHHNEVYAAIIEEKVVGFSMPSPAKPARSSWSTCGCCRSS